MRLFTTKYSVCKCNLQSFEKSHATLAIKVLIVQKRKKKKRRKNPVCQNIHVANINTVKYLHLTTTYGNEKEICFIIAQSHYTSRACCINNKKAKNTNSKFKEHFYHVNPIPDETYYFLSFFFSSQIKAFT